MTDRGVIFSGPMVIALLEGRKTQTRRLTSSPLAKCGLHDRLWVRENCAALERDTDGKDGIFYLADDDFVVIDNCRDAADRWLKLNHYGSKAEKPRRNAVVPSIHMPRWASRITLMVRRVWIEPLQDISRSDCYAEGCSRPAPGAIGSEVCAIDNARNEYRKIWNALHTDEGERWEDKPDVLALEFEVQRANIDKLSA